jgi:uncharacterized protein (TIGR03437 family)
VTADDSAREGAAIVIERTDDPSIPPEVITVTVARASTGAAGPVIDEVTNGASFDQAISAGSWVTIKGTGLYDGSGFRLWDDQIVGGRLPTSLGGVSVTVNDKPAYIYYVSPTQINFVSPDDRAPGEVTLVVTNNGKRSAGVKARLEQFSPAIFQVGLTKKYAIATTPAYVRYGNPALPGPALTPAKPGDIIILWCTGLGPTNPAIREGFRPPGGSPITNTATVWVDGERIQPGNFIGAAISGDAALYQVAFYLPERTRDGDIPVKISVGDHFSQDRLFLYVRR